MILHSLIISKSFSCSTIWAGTLKQNLQKHIMTNTKKFDHITPVLQELVTAQGMKISYNLPFVELLPLSVLFLSFNKYLELPLLKLWKQQITQ